MNPTTNQPDHNPTNSRRADYSVPSQWRHEDTGFFYDRVITVSLPPDSTRGPPNSPSVPPWFQPLAGAGKGEASRNYKKQLAGLQGITAVEAAAREYGTAFSTQITKVMDRASRRGLAMQGDPLAGILDKTYYPGTEPEVARLRTTRRNIEAKIAAARFAKTQLERQIAAANAELQAIEDKREDAEASLRSDYPLYSLVEDVGWMVEQLEEALAESGKLNRDELLLRSFPQITRGLLDLLVAKSARS